jgi:hypothetical protein
MATPRKARPHAKTGRKELWTATVDRSFFTALSSGCSFADAAIIAGVSPDTLQRRQRNNPEFCGRLTHARTEFKVRSLAFIAKAAQTEWRAAQFWLERVYPEEWGARVETPVAGPTTNVFVGSSNESVTEILRLCADVALPPAPARPLPPPIESDDVAL